MVGGWFGGLAVWRFGGLAVWRWRPGVVSGWAVAHGKKGPLSGIQKGKKGAVSRQLAALVLQKKFP